MREYGKLAPQFWTGETGKELREAGPLTQVIACYLVTCPSATMLGLYYIPLPTLCHEVGCSLQAARKALRRLSEAQFAYYDSTSEYVWIPNMARFEVGATLKPDDKQVVGIKKALQALKHTPFYNEFLSRYTDLYHLSDLSAIEAPSKPHRSQEQEQDTPRGGVSAELELTPDDLQHMWNAMPGLKPCKELDADIKTSIRRRLREHPTREFWVARLEQIRSSKFLTGRVNGTQDPFYATLDWIVKPANLGKLLRGNYDSVQTPKEKERLPL